jgi:hypothetical protein
LEESTLETESNMCNRRCHSGDFAVLVRFAGTNRMCRRHSGTLSLLDVSEAIRAYLTWNNDKLMSCFIGTSWCQQASGTSKPLVSAFFWYRQPLMSASQHGSGVSMALVSAWPVLLSLITMTLVSPDFWYQIFWCQESMFATQSAIGVRR